MTDASEVTHNNLGELSKKLWRPPVLRRLPIAATAHAKGANTSDGGPGSKNADAGTIS